MAAPYEQEVVSWHHSDGQPPLGLQVVIGELARTGVTGVDNTLLIPGWGETAMSAIKSVQTLEDEGIPAIAGYFSYCMLPPTKANLRRIVNEAPLRLADFARQTSGGDESRVNLVTHSLACLAVIAAAKEPGMFGSVVLDSPHVFSCKTWGPEWIRPFVAAKRLAVDTGWQLRGHRSDERLKSVFGEAISEVIKLGRNAHPAATLALSDEIADEAIDSYVQMSLDGHQSLIVTGGDDRIASPHEMKQTLAAAAIAAGLDKWHFISHLVELPGLPHLPWSFGHEAKFQQFKEVLKSQTPPKRKMAA